ncbi:MAG TPA: hypothetical protein VE441_10790 [Mycobacterium sp.]|jgi:hypothetical protein|nr:hypothetical protein [Mycobacterium sp.]
MCAVAALGPPAALVAQVEQRGDMDTARIGTGSSQASVRLREQVGFAARADSS